MDGAFVKSEKTKLKIQGVFTDLVPFREHEPETTRMGSFESNSTSVVLCTHYVSYKTNDPDLWNCKTRNGCIEGGYSSNNHKLYLGT